MRAYSATNGRNEKKVRPHFRKSYWVPECGADSEVRDILEQIPVFFFLQTDSLFKGLFKTENFLFPSQVLDCRLLQRNISDESKKNEHPQSKNFTEIIL